MHSLQSTGSLELLSSIMTSALKVQQHSTVATYFLKMHQVLEYMGTWQYHKWITCMWKHEIGIIN